MNRLRYITELDEFMDVWPFLLEGLTAMNERANDEVPSDRFLKVLLRVALGDPDDGALIVLESKNKNASAFIVLINNSAVFDQRSAMCYAVYAVKGNLGAVKQLDTEAKRWCKEHDYTLLYAASKNISGAAVRWFERRRGFRKHSLVFVRSV